MKYFSTSTQGLRSSAKVTTLLLALLVFTFALSNNANASVRNCVEKKVARTTYSNILLKK